MKIKKFGLRTGAVTIFTLFTLASSLRAQETVHIISMYEPSYVHTDIIVPKQDAPVTLILSSYEEVIWHIMPKRLSDVKRVIVNSYSDSIAWIHEPRGSLNDSDIEVEYYLTQKYCFPGDSRDALEPIQFANSIIKANKPKQVERFFSGLEEATDIKADRNSSVIKASYYGKNVYRVLPDKIKGKRDRPILKE